MAVARPQPRSSAGAGVECGARADDRLQVPSADRQRQPCRIGRVEELPAREPPVVEGHTRDEELEAPETARGPRLLDNLDGGKIPSRAGSRERFAGAALARVRTGYGRTSCRRPVRASMCEFVPRVRGAWGRVWNHRQRSPRTRATWETGEPIRHRRQPTCRERASGIG